MVTVGALVAELRVDDEAGGQCLIGVADGFTGERSLLCPGGHRASPASQIQSFFVKHSSRGEVRANTREANGATGHS